MKQFCILLLACLFVVANESCHRVDIESGVYGKVTKRVGNWMPGINDSSAQEYALECEVALFDSINIQDMGESIYRERVAISDVNIHEIARVATDKKGFYQLEVPAGKYSIAVVDRDSLIMKSLNVNNGYGWLAPLILFEGEPQEHNIFLDYAVY